MSKEKKKKLTLKNFKGTPRKFNDNNIKTLKDFAELSTDEIIGGYDEIKGKREKFDGILEEFSISRKDAEDLIMRARKKVFNF